MMMLSHSERDPLSCLSTPPLVYCHKDLAEQDKIFMSGLTVEDRRKEGLKEINPTSDKLYLSRDSRCCENVLVS